MSTKPKGKTLALAAISVLAASAGAIAATGGDASDPAKPKPIPFEINDLSNTYLLKVLQRQRAGANPAPAGGPARRRCPSAAGRCRVAHGCRGR